MKKIRLITDDKHSEFLSILISYLLVFLIPMSLITVGIFLFANDNASVQVEKAYEEALETMKNDVDKNLEKLGTYAIQMSESNWVKKMMYSNAADLRYGRIDPTLYQNAVAEMNLYKHINGFVSNMALCFHDNDIVISDLGKDSFDSFFNDVFCFSEMDSEQWEKELSVQNNKTLKPPAEVQQNRLTYRKLVYIQSLPIAQKNPHASFIALIDESALKELVNNAFITTEGCICILDEEEQFVAANSMNSELLQLVSEKSGISDVKKIKSQKVKLADGRKYKTFYSKSQLNGWVYIAYVPQDALATKMHDISLFIFIVCLASLVIGMILVCILTLRSYTPLANLVKTIRPEFLSSNIKNEYDFLHAAMNAMQEHEERAAKKLELYEPIVRNSFFVRLLKGEMNINSDLLEALDIRFGDGLFTCISILFNDGEPGADDLDSRISAVISEQAVSFFVAAEDKENKTIILNCAQEEQPTQVAALLKEYFDTENISCRAIGVGKTYQNIADIQKSYHESKMALDYYRVSGKSSILYADKIETINGNSAYYCPVGSEEKLINLLKCDNPEGALKICSEIETENLEGEELSCAKGRALYYHLAVTALKAAAKDSIKKTLNPESLLQMKTAEEMRSYMAELFQCICSGITMETNKKSTQFRQEIIDYLNGNFNDSHLDLSTMANKFNISPTYLSRLVKNQTGMNFLEYVHRKRIEAAKLLLRENITVLKVGQLVGYDNDISFRRQFKKYEGITPGEYKKYIADTAADASTPPPPPNTHRR